MSTDMHRTESVGTGGHRYPPKLRPGDRVAVLSPSTALPAKYPERFELGLRRMHDVFGLVPVEYPTTRAVDAAPRDKAADLMDAFDDPDIAAIWASAGGIDELKVLAHLDASRIAAHPKAFIGYSDNTNLHLFLFNLGLVSYHGPMVMFQLAFAGGLDDVTHESLRRALFSGGEHELSSGAPFVEESVDPWLTPLAQLEGGGLGPSAAWTWHGPSVRVSGPAWGGSLEVVDFHLRTGRYLMPNVAYRGCVAFFETSQELPAPSFAARVLTCMGERGLLGQFGAIVWGQPASWSESIQNTPEERAHYVEEQRETVLSVVDEYNPGAPVVFGVGFGHTRPQIVIPSGGTVQVDVQSRRLSVSY